jgi:hypothetical protein
LTPSWPKSTFRLFELTLATGEFIRRLLIHVLPRGFHRIRHYGLFAKASCVDNIARARELLAAPEPRSKPTNSDTIQPSNIPVCPCCGGRMVIIETFQRGCAPRSHPATPPAAIRIDTS